MGRTSLKTSLEARVRSFDLAINIVTMKVMITVTLLLAVLASLSDAEPQQRRRQQQQRRRRPAQGQARRQNTELVTLGDGTQVKEDITLADITDQQLNQFMAKKSAVKLLVNCFEPRAVCKFKTARALVSDVRKLGKGGVCGSDVCTNGQEKAKVERLVKRAIAIMQKRHKTEWRQLIPNIVF